MNETSKLDQLLDAGRAATGAPERHAVTLTLLVVDVAAAESYFQRQGGVGGAAPAYGVLEQSERMGTRAVDGYGGRVVRMLGDTLLAEFSEPELAVQAAVHLQRRLAQMRASLPKEEQIQLRMGVARGRCFRAGGDLFGEGVERCAAICKRAGPAQILIAQEMREAVAGHREINCTLVGAVKIGEREENLFEVVWAEPAEYAELRQHTTMALRRGDLRVPGMQITELVQPELQRQPAATLALPAEVVGQRTGEFVPTVPASLGKRYDIRGELGRGGMGVVYKAWDRETEEMVALKVLRGEIATDAAALVRFRNEVRVARRVTHKNVCRIHDFNRTEDAAYISMEFIEGRSLRSLIAESDGLSVERGSAIAAQICAGLEEAHRQGIVHRDLKPENVMLDREGTVRLLDFGIARLAAGSGVTQTGAVMGTPAYMAPEQAEGTNIDHRVDIYALGLILYEMFTGTPTFRAPTPLAVVMKHLQEQPTPPREFKPTLPGHIEQTILRCLAKKPAERFQTVPEVMAALEGRSEASSVGTMPAGTERAGVVGEKRAKPGSARPFPTVPMPTVDQPSPAEPLRGAQPAAAALRALAPGARGSGAKVWIALGVAALVLATGAALYFKPWAAQGPAAQPNVAGASLPTQPPLQQPLAKSDAAPKHTSGAQPEPASKASASDPPQAVERQPERSVPATVAAGNTPASSDAAAKPIPERNVAALPPEPARAVPPVALTFAFVNAFGERKGAVNGVALSADGRRIATAGQDRTVGIWDANAGRQIHKLRGHTDAVLGVAFSRDGSRVASGSADRTARIWSASSGAEELALAKESAPILQVAFSPDGQLLATSLGDGRIKLWEAATGAAVQNLVGHSGPVYSIAFSGDGRLLVSGGRDGTVRVWTVASGSERVSLRNESGAVSAVAISADGRWIAAGGGDGAVRVWEASGRQAATLSSHSGSVDAVAFGPGGRWLVSGGSDKMLRAWELPSGREIASMERHFFGITDLALSASGRSMASADSGGTLMLWRWR